MPLTGYQRAGQNSAAALLVTATRHSLGGRLSNEPTELMWGRGLPEPGQFLPGRR